MYTKFCALSTSIHVSSVPKHITQIFDSWIFAVLQVAGFIAYAWNRACVMQNIIKHTTGFRLEHM